jgi:hypothetical protein
MRHDGRDELLFSVSFRLYYFEGMDMRCIEKVHNQLFDGKFSLVGTIGILPRWTGGVV